MSAVGLQNTIIFFRNLCIEIGEKTNVYSLEVSMHGYEIENDDPAEDNEIITYSEEDCKFYSVFPDLLFMKWLELVTLVLLNPFKSNTTIYK